MWFGIIVACPREKTTHYKFAFEICFNSGNCNKRFSFFNEMFSAIYLLFTDLATNHKNYNFLNCEWFKKLFPTNSLAKLLSDILLSDSLLSDSLL